MDNTEMEYTDWTKFDDDADRYFKGEMPPDQEQAWLARVNSDPEMKQRLTVIALMKKSMREIRQAETRNLTDEIASMSESQYRRHTQRPRIHTSLWGRWASYAAAACAVVLLGFAAWRFFEPSPYTSLGESYDYLAYNTDLSDYLNRGDDEGFTQQEIEQLQATFADVQAGRDIDRAITHLNTMLIRAQVEDSDFYNPIAWNLAIAYLKSGDGGAARMALEDMRRRNDGLYPKVVEQIDLLIERIDEIDAH